MPGKLFILGYPLAHSVSPHMHNAAFKELGLDYRYSVMPVEPGTLLGCMSLLRRPEVRGANVTVPHKEAVIPLLDELGPTALQAGAVNTILNEGGKLSGHNTDLQGFTQALMEAGCRVEGAAAAVVGAGGSARAVAAGLALCGARVIRVINRTPDKARRLLDHLEAICPGVAAEWVELGKNAAALQDAGLVVNCTPLGMFPHVETVPPLELEALPPWAVVVDIVYNPPGTMLLRKARALGLRTLGGLGMLVNQAACSWKIWFGEKGPVDVMKVAALEALSR